MRACYTKFTSKKHLLLFETLFASEIWSSKWHRQVSRSFLDQGTLITLSLIAFSTDLDNTTSFASNNHNNKIQNIFNVCHLKAKEKTFSRRLKIIPRCMLPAKQGNDHKICIEIVTDRILISREKIFANFRRLVNEILIRRASEILLSMRELDAKAHILCVSKSGFE